MAARERADPAERQHDQSQRMTSHGGSLFDFGPLAREYDRWYDTPAGRAHDRVQKSDVRRLLQVASEGQALLDVGCGTGHWASFFAEMGYRVTGVDTAPAMIEVAKSSAPECSFEVADACDLPFEDGSFDVVASMAMLEFVRDRPTALGEMVRCAKAGGTLLVGTLNRLAPLNQRRVAEGKRPYCCAHLYSPTELGGLLATWGRVRMRASSPRRHGSRRLPARGIANRSGLRRGKVDGPFIVAEVRLWT